MRRSFSFAGDHPLFLLENIPSILPGIEKAITIFYSPENQKLLSHSLVKEKEEYIPGEVNIESSLTILSRFRSETAPFTWLKKDDLPFDVKSVSKVEMTIFSELSNNILLIRIPNNFDALNDLFFIYLNQDLSNFGTVNSNQLLTTENKKIIGSILRNSLMTLLSNICNDKEQFAILQENTQLILRENDQKRNETAGIKEKYKDSMVHLSLEYLKEISASDGIRYRLTEQAVEKIKNFQGDIRVIKPVIEKAARISGCYNISPNPDHRNIEHSASDSNVIYIDHYHIVFQDIKEKKVPESIPEPAGEVPVRYVRTMALLDKLENAAVHLKSKNKMLTSANLGNEFPTPVSPPAITDSLKKHRSKILYLFKEYPNRWGTIRSEFRPVQNILNIRHDLDRNTATA
ncbi:MAG: hypothetical protein Q8867_02650 [Bacteroidota bacterium]|nr:hypothetical protein [Bacteroidota bacterium]